MPGRIYWPEVALVGFHRSILSERLVTGRSSGKNLDLRDRISKGKLALAASSGPADLLFRRQCVVQVYVWTTKLSFSRRGHRIYRICRCFGDGTATNLLFQTYRARRNRNFSRYLRCGPFRGYWMLGNGASPKARPLCLRNVHRDGRILLVCILVVAYYRVKQLII